MLKILNKIITEAIIYKILGSDVYILQSEHRGVEIVGVR
jgi:hypothetical protein